MPTHIPESSWGEFVRAVGVNLQRGRMARGLSQERLAYSADISRFAYQQLEKGESRPHTPANPSLRNIMALAQVLDVPLERLLPGPWPDLRAK